MWYNTIPQVDFSAWLSQAVALFNRVSSTMLAVPMFGFLLWFALLLAIISMLCALLRQGSRGRL